VLLTNGSTPVQARFLAGTLGETTRLHGAFPRRLYANAMAFGQRASQPVGYQSVLRAIIPPLGTSGQIAARVAPLVSLTADLRGLGNMAAALAPEFSVTAAANVLSNMAATFTVAAAFTASLRATGSMSAVFDWISRPSANDIAQEVWNSFRIEGGMSGGDVMRVLLAVAAGKTVIDDTGPVIVTFRDQADTKDRVRAEMIGSERDAVTVDGA
jgi:hypothetical protein